MTQSTYTQERRRKLASQPTRKVRTLAERRADFEAQMREIAAKDGTVAFTDLSQVSNRIKEVRERTGLTQYDFAAKIKVAPRTYQSWENGEVETSRENYAKIAKAGKVSTNWILFGQEEEPPMPSQKRAEDRAATLSELNEAEERAVARHAEVLTALAELRSLLEPEGKQEQQEQRKQGGR